MCCWWLGLWRTDSFSLICCACCNRKNINHKTPLNAFNENSLAGFDLEIVIVIGKLAELATLTNGYVPHSVDIHTTSTLSLSKQTEYVQRRVGFDYKPNLFSFCFCVVENGCGGGGDGSVLKRKHILRFKHGNKRVCERALAIRAIYQHHCNGNRKQNKKIRSCELVSMRTIHVLYIASGTWRWFHCLSFVCAMRARRCDS